MVSSSSSITPATEAKLAVSRRLFSWRPSSKTAPARPHFGPGTHYVGELYSIHAYGMRIIQGFIYISQCVIMMLHGAGIPHDRTQAREGRYGASTPEGPEIERLQERLSRPSEASLRINEGLEFDAFLRALLDGTRPQRIMLECAATRGVV